MALSSPLMAVATGTTKSLLIDMKTEIKPITAESLQLASELIAGGDVVGMPTETVYGLAGNAFDDNAVRRIFEVKGRPSDNPLIAHVYDGYDLSRIIDYDPPYAQKLREAFLPGPLTLVYPSTGKVSPLVSCGLNTLAVRVPAHAGAQSFLKAVGVPIAAPSANLSKHVSPTSAGHVYDDFNGKVPLILDGGECVGGIESTVCDITGEIPVILRPGLITQEMIADVVGACGVYEHKVDSKEKVKSPGVLYKHYSPRCQTKLFACGEADFAMEFLRSVEAGVKVCVLCEDAVAGQYVSSGFQVLNLGATEDEMAARLYAHLRTAEETCDLLVAIEPSKKDGKMAGVNNRLRKACASVDIPH